MFLYKSRKEMKGNCYRIKEKESKRHKPENKRISEEKKKVSDDWT